MKEDYSCFISGIIEQVLHDYVKKTGRPMEDEILERILVEYSNSIKRNYPNKDLDKRNQANVDWRFKHQKRCGEYFKKKGIKDIKKEFLKYRDVDNKNQQVIEEKEKIISISKGENPKIKQLIKNKVIDPSCLALKATNSILNSKKSTKEQDKLLDVYIPRLKKAKENDRQKILESWTEKQVEKCNKFFKKNNIIGDDAKKEYYNNITGMQSIMKKIEECGGKLADKQRKNSIFDTESVRNPSTCSMKSFSKFFPI